MSQTLTLQPAEAASQDCRIHSAAPTENLNDASLSVGEDNSTVDTLRTLIKFDLSSLPTNAKVSTATLSLTLKLDRSSNARTFRVYRQLRAWTETGATWNKYDGTNNWQTAGGFGANDCEQTDIGNTAFTATETIPSVKDFALTPSAIDEIAAGTFTNNGFLIKADTESNDAYSFESSANATEANRPKLVVVYNYQTSAAGTLASSGAIVRKTSKVVAGTLTSAGAAAKKMFKSLAGTLTSVGAVFTKYTIGRDSRHIVQAYDARHKVNADTPTSTVTAVEGRKNVDADTWRNT